MDLTEERAEERVKSPDNLLNLIIQHKRKGDGSGKKNGDLQIPEELKQVIIETEGSQKDLANAFGFSAMTASFTKRGRVGNRKDDSLLSAVENKKQASARMSIDILHEILEEIPSKIENAKLKDLSSAAKDMATVHEKLNGIALPSGSNVIIYAPRMMKEVDLEVIELNPAE